MKTKNSLFIAGLLMSTGLLGQPTGGPGNSLDWRRGGNTFTPNSNNIFGFGPTFNSQIWYQTNGFNRMVMDKGGASISDGRLGFGNNLSGTFIAQDRFHSDISVTGPNMFRYTNPTSGSSVTDGVRMGLVNVVASGYGSGDVGLFDQLEQSIFRFDIASNSSPATQFTKFTIGNIDQKNVTTTYQPSYTNATRAAIWEGTSYFPGSDPLAMLHVGSPAPLNAFGHKDWMNIGTYYNAGSDGMYVGIKENASNGIDAVVAWGDDGGAAEANQGDRLKFIFNTNYAPGGPLRSGEAEGLEVARFNTTLGNDGSAIFNGGSIGGTLDPLNTVHVVGQSTAGNAATAGGNSGLRFEYLRAGITPTTTNPGSGLLSVDANGDVIYVPCCSVSGPGSVTAQNGLNTLQGPNIVELGGSLLRATDITTFGGGTRDLTVNGTGQFAVTEYPLVPSGNGQASQLTSDYKAGFFNNSYQKTLRVENIKAAAATNAQWGEEIIVDLDNTSNLTTIGESVTVTSDGANTYGISSSAKARTSSASSSGLLNVVGIGGTGLNGYHTWGGIFNASTTVVNTPNTWAHGIECNATGGNLEAIGGIFYAQGSPSWNQGVYAISRNNGTFPGTKCYGVHGLADAANAGGWNVGVLGIGNEFVCANNTTTAIGVAGIIGSNSWGTNYFPTGLRIGVFGSNDFAGGFGACNGSWAAYFDGPVFSTVGYFPSDKNLKKEVKEIDKSLEIIKKLNPVTYKFKDENKAVNLPSEQQYGFISQEVEKILPELTRLMSIGARKDSTGNEVAPAQEVLTLNYNAFIAILTKGMKEQQETIEEQKEKVDDLQEQIDELKELITSKPSATSDENGTAQINVELSDGQNVVLDQNVPNPFAEQTTISYVIPPGSGKAQILFYSAAGQLIKSVEITEKGNGKLNVFANDLSNGMYTYSLVVDGKIIGTMKMQKQDQ